MQRFIYVLAAALAAVTAVGVHAAGALTYCIDSSPEGFDIAQYETNPSFDAGGIALYDQIIELAPGTSHLVPGLAESWLISNDGLQYTFKLRPGVAFHSTAWFKPTRPMNADDVLFSIRRMAEQNALGPCCCSQRLRLLAGHEHVADRQVGRQDRCDDGALHPRAPRGAVSF